jgi:hypothetical protein
MKSSSRKQLKRENAPEPSHFLSTYTHETLSKVMKPETRFAQIFSAANMLAQRFMQANT